MAQSKIPTTTELKIDTDVVGDVVHSVLTEAQFQAIRGPNWVLCDGRDVSGSRLATLTGNNLLPDVRGQHLRGKNNGRSDGEENPSGDLNIGIQESDQMQSHFHNWNSTNHLSQTDAYTTPINYLTGDSTNGGSGPPTATFQNQNYVDSPKTDPGVGAVKKGTETRVKAVTVNMFIKIN